jgi:hypothetical protein
VVLLLLALAWHWALFTSQHHTLPLYPPFGQRLAPPPAGCADTSITASSNVTTATSVADYWRNLILIH